MALGETTVTVVGNVASELSRRSVGNGSEVVSFWLRSNERRYDKQEQTWVDGRQFAIKVTCWRRLGVGVHESVAKGDPVIVTGKLFTSEFESQGQHRSIPELEATALGPNLNWCTATICRGTRGADEPVRGSQTSAAAHEPLRAA